MLQLGVNLRRDLRYLISAVDEVKRRVQPSK